MPTSKDMTTLEKKKPSFFRWWFLAIIVVVSVPVILWYASATRHPCDIRGELFFSAECKIFRANTEVLSEAGHTDFENPSEGEYVQSALGITVRFESLPGRETTEDGDLEETAVYFEFDERASLENGISRTDHREITNKLFFDLAPIDDRALEIIVLNGNCKNDAFPDRSAFHQLDAEKDVDSASISESSFEADIEWTRECIAFKDTEKYPVNIDHTTYLRTISIRLKSN